MRGCRLHPLLLPVPHQITRPPATLSSPPPLPIPRTSPPILSLGAHSLTLVRLLTRVLSPISHTLSHPLTLSPTLTTHLNTPSPIHTHTSNHSVDKPPPPRAGANPPTHTSPYVQSLPTHHSTWQASLLGVKSPASFLSRALLPPNKEAIACSISNLLALQVVIVVLVVLVSWSGGGRDDGVVSVVARW